MSIPISPNCLHVRRVLQFLLIVLAIVALNVALSATAAAADYIVDTSADGIVVPGCTLREAINAANFNNTSNGCTRVGGGNPDRITFAPALVGATITINSILADFDINGDLLIVGSGQTIAGGTPASRVFQINTGVTAELNNLTVTNGSNETYGGGILNNGGLLTLRNVTVRNNTATTGGGGVANGNNGTLTVINSTVSGNSATTNGTGGGIYNSPSSTLILQNSTIAFNSATSGGGIFNDNGTVNIENTIVAQQSQGANCSGAITSNGHNLADDNTCQLNQPGDKPNTSAGLQALANNGGDTVTHALALSSAARDAGNNATCQSVDQRGISRPQPTTGGTCDIGAFEAQVGTITIKKLSDPADGTPFTFNLTNFPDASVPLAHNGTKSYTVLANGTTYTIQEDTVTPAGWQLTDIICAGTANVAYGGNTAAVTLGANEKVECTFTNKKLGSITVVKEATPEGPQSFGFTFNGNPLVLVDNGTAANTSIQGSLLPGVYNIVETIPASWLLTGIVCSGGSGSSFAYNPVGGVGFDAGDTTASVTLAAGENILCTFNNAVQTGTIIVVKEANPKTSTDFAVTVSNTNPNKPYSQVKTVDDPLVDDADAALKTQTFANAPIGTINLVEALPNGWHTELIACSDGTPTVFANSASLVLGAGQTITCMIYNRQTTSPIKLIKLPLQQTVGEGDNVNFSIYTTNMAAASLTSVDIVDALCDGDPRFAPHVNATDPSNPPHVVIAGNGGATLEQNEIWRYDCVDQNVGNQDYVNTATINALNGGPVSASASANVTVRKRGIDIEKRTASGSAIAFQGSDVKFILEVRNTSQQDPNSSADNFYAVTVTDLKCSAAPVYVSGDDGDGALEPTETWSYECTANSVTSDFLNEARVDACTGNVALASCVSSNYDIWFDRDHLDIRVINPDIEIEKTPHDQTVLANSSVNFEITLRNLGDQNLNNVGVQDLMCDGGAPVRKADQVGNNDNVLNVGEIWRFTCAVSDIGEQDVNNRVTVEATDPNNNKVTDYDDVRVDVIHPTIDLEKKPDPLFLLEGQTANFFLEVKNTGDQPLTNVKVIDAKCDATLTPLPGPVSGDNAPLGQLDPGETWIYQCSVPNVTSDFVNRATVTAKDSHNNAVGDEDEAQVDVLGRGIDIEKQSTTPIAIQGKDVKFTLEVQNTGAAPLRNVKVSDSKCDAPNNPLPGPASGDTANPGVLDPTETWVYECTTSNVQTSFTNYAQVVAQDGAGNPADDDDIFDVKVVNPKIFLEKLPKNASFLQGSDVLFTLNVRNLGDQNLTITSFSDPLCAKPPLYVSGDDGDAILEPGEIWKYTCTVTNVQADFTNVAVVKAKDPNSIEVQDTEDAEIDVVSAGIDLKKTADTPQIFQGQTAKFTLAVKKTGAENLRSVDIIDAKCGWAEHANPNDPSNPPTSGDTNNNGILESGETWIYRCSIPNAVADFSNSARVKAREVTSGLPVEASASANVDVLNPGINVEKTTTTPVVAQGATVKFLIIVQNTGQADLSNLVLQDGICVGGKPTPIFGGIGVLQPTEKWQYECVVTNVQNDFNNTVTVSALDPASNQVNHNATAHVDVVNPAIDLEKTPENQTILAGAKAQFTLRIKNTGDLDLHNVVLTDAFCDGGAPTLVSKGDNDANNILKPNEVWEYSCVRSAVQADFTNTASVTALDPANKQVGDSEQAIVHVIQPGMTLNKRPESQAVLKGGTATFFLDVTNTGNADLIPVTVSDVLCSAAPVLNSGDNNNDGKLNAGETWSYTCGRNNVVEDFINVASVIFADVTGNQLTRTDTATVNVINGGIDIEKSADNTTLLKGQTVKFTLSVLNTGQTPLTITEIKDPLCDTAPVLVNKGDGDADLDVNETWLYECIKSNLQSSFTNVASVKGVDANNNAVSDIDDITIKVINPAIDLEKTPEFQAVLQGATVEFILEVRNIGDQPLKITKLEDAECTVAPSFLGGDTNDDGLLQTGEVWRYRCIVTNVTTNFTNKATVTAQDGNGNIVSDTEEAKVEVVDPGIDLQKTADEPTIYKGSAAKFTIVVRNTGDQPLTITDISDPLCDADPVLVGGDSNNNGKLDLTEFWVYTCSKANAQDDFTNTANVTAKDANGITVTSGDSADVDVINPGIDLEKSAQNQSVIQGDNASFTLSVRNTGQSDLTNVVVTDALCNIGPDYITFTGAGDGNADGILQVGEVWIYSCIVLNVQAGFTNEATVTAKDVPGNTVSDLDQATVAVVKAGMNVKMQASSLVIDSGDNIEFTIVVRNTGEEDLQNVNVTADTCSPSYQSGDANDDKVLQTIETWVYICTIDQVSGASLTTTVTVSAQDANGNTLSRKDTVVISTLQPDGTGQLQFLYLPLIQSE